MKWVEDLLARKNWLFSSLAEGPADSSLPKENVPIEKQREKLDKGM